MVRTDPNNGKGSAEVVATTVNEDSIQALDSFAAALDLFGGQAVNIADVAGDGFTRLETKATLLNIPLLVIDWEEVIGTETQKLFATIRVITTDGRKYRIADGSTGMMRQLQEIRDNKGVTRGILVKGGLVESKYFIDDDTREIIPADKVATWTGAKSPASTFYFATS